MPGAFPIHSLCLIYARTFYEQSSQSFTNIAVEVIRIFFPIHIIPAHCLSHSLLPSSLAFLGINQYVAYIPTELLQQHGSIIDESIPLSTRLKFQDYALCGRGLLVELNSELYLYKYYGIETFHKFSSHPLERMTDS